MDLRHYDPKQLVEAREKDGKSQEELATLLNVNRQTIYRAEAGKSASFELLADYCRIYGIAVTEIIKPHPEKDLAAT